MRWLIIFVGLLANLSAVSAEIDGQSLEVARLGRGVVYSIDWRPDERVLAVGSASGIWFYSDSYDVLAHLPDAGTQAWWSPEGQRLLILTPEGSEIWRINDDGTGGEPILSIPGMERGVWRPDGTMIAGRRVIGEEVAAVVWDTESGAALFELVSEVPYSSTGRSYDLITYERRAILVPDFAGFAWSPDGKELAIPRFHSVEIRDADTGFELARELLATDIVGTEIAWAGSRIYTSGDTTSQPFIWNAVSGELVAEPDFCGNPCIADSITQILPNQDETKVALVWRHNTWEFEGPAFGVKIVDTDTGEILDSDLDSEFIMAAWNGEEITGITRSGDFTLWNKNLAIPSLSQDRVTTVAWSPDSGEVASASGGALISTQPINLWEISDDERFLYEPQVIGLQTATARELIWTAENGLAALPIYDFVSAGASMTCESSVGEVYRWRDPITQPVPEILPTIESDQHQYFAILGWNPDFSRALVFEILANAVYLLNASDGQLVELELPEDVYGYMTHRAVWNPEGQSIAISSCETSLDITIWNPDDNTVLARIDQIADPTLFWRPDGGALLILDIVPGEDSPKTFVRVFDMESGRISESSLENWSLFAAWHPDGSAFAINVGDTAVQFRDGHTGELIEQVAIDGVSSLAWSPDGTRLALGSEDGRIRIWDVTRFVPAI